MKKIKLCRELFLIIIKEELYTASKTEDIYLNLEDLQNHFNNCEICKAEMKKILTDYISKQSFISRNLLNQLIGE